MVVAKAEAGKTATNYFRTARPLPSLVTVLGLGYFAWVIFGPQSIPYQSLGPLGLFTQYLVDHHHTLLHNCYWLAWLIHVGESLYAIVLCKTHVSRPPDIYVTSIIHTTRHEQTFWCPSSRRPVVQTT
ncbi:transmembrane protein 254 isoform X2 [Pteronotus mesoamericanus]|uniref:transmembrane protein 254 isoform X2 n=1 Tax=Pteronotus mesoamericanus TaxID=1884717 RepID=UPI0023EDA1EA|nr:transmembrane protein 254 isoform X2 [Pteronotus parnellii mesoamericanus]